MLSQQTLTGFHKALSKSPELSLEELLESIHYGVYLTASATDEQTSDNYKIAMEMALMIVDVHLKELKVRVKANRERTTNRFNITPEDIEIIYGGIH
jgi:hypothetical protein